MYPEGCDVSNHLSLFLCVANHDELLPGLYFFPLVCLVLVFFLWILSDIYSFAILDTRLESVGSVYYICDA